MGSRVLCLTLLAILPAGYGQPCALITPSVLHLDSEETIVIDGHNKASEAEVEIQDFTNRGLSLAKHKISLNNGNQFLSTATVKIPSKNLAKNPKSKQYVYVTVKSPMCNLEKVVPLSYQSGYVFIQPNKAIYTPGSTVHYHMFFMNHKMSSVKTTMITELLNPENVIVKREKVQTEEDSGIISSSHNLTDPVSPGVWTISAKYEDSPEQNYSAHFEVKEYVLPTFEVQLIPEKKYFHVDDSEFSVDIKANYHFGKPVNGMAFGTFGVKKDDVRTNLQDTLRRILIVDGLGRVVLRREDLVKSFSNEDEMLQHSLYMSATITTDSGEEMVENKLEDIYIVRSPYKVLLTKIPKYFKVGMPFDLLVFVTNPDGSPANRVPVVAEPGEVEGITGPEGTTRLTLNTGSDMKALQITVRTSHPALPSTQQATATMTANAYQPDGNYLHIGISATEVKPGDDLAVNFNIPNTNMAAQNQIQHITYLIMNKGQIQKMGRQPRQQGQKLVTMSLPITEEFTPSFCIVGYYIARNEIVSDSMWVDVTNSSMETVSMMGKTKRDNEVQSPGSTMKLQLQADHMAKVALMAIDKRVSAMPLNSEFKTSQKKVRDSVEKSDLGCSPGSGADSMRVFYDAGLALQTSFHTTTHQRSECEVHAARRRRASTQLVGKRTTNGMLSSSGADDDAAYLQDADIVSRIDNPESWLWTVEQMTEAPDKNGISTKVLDVALKDSITTWEVMAVSLSQNKGIHVSKPYEIQVLQDFFIDLRMPYSVVRDKQVEIRAVMYNYGSDKIKVRAELTHNPEFSSLSTAKANYRQIVEIRPQSSVVVPFTLVPLSLGDHDVEVKAAVSGQSVSDGIRKKLRVVPEGIRINKIVKQMTLDPQAKGKDGVQEEAVYPLDVKDIIPRTDFEILVTYEGNPRVIQTAEDVIDGANLSPLIAVPQGSGEQAMMTMAPNVIATIYLDATDQWGRIGVNRRTEALNNIKQGYKHQLGFRKPDSSYAAWINGPSCTWLNAYIAKILALAHPLVDIESNALCGAVKWSILERQMSDGRFREDFTMYNAEMTGGVESSSDDVALTAFVLIAMLESEKICSPHVRNLKVGIEKATNFLLGHYPGLVKLYTIAITSYALAMAGAIDNPEKLRSASADKVQWNDPGDRLVTIEATSYALLAYSRLQQFDHAGPIVRWLKEQNFFGADSGSTQAALVMFQALAQYKTDIASLSEMDLEVSINLPESPSPITYNIKVDNALVAHSTVIRTNKEFTVKAKGKGQGTMMVTSAYYAPVSEKEKEGKNFDLSVTATEEANGPEGDLITASLEIFVRHLKDKDATMSILDISMMTGFVPDIKSLNRLNREADKNSSKYEINKDAADKGILLIYLDKISHKHDESIRLNVQQIYRAGLIQPGSVTVYEYNAPENGYTKFYQVEKNSNLLRTI
ncbi:A.superbus venom factor 1-like [Leptodactylus fuscus]|uniref:A.superbus venom factor 1-like n=1 Tax=Leptodactylus fuscus TaxID=238119 RepID=UPI003F4F36B1